ncbi:MAG: GNAT family N-acetyltransferase [Firmicutes bacterium]|nr:GNAT family N-acetyltransferase [Bacillota bacterium]
MKPNDTLMVVKATHENMKDLVSKYYYKQNQNSYLAKNFTLEALNTDIGYLIDKGLSYVSIENEVPVGYILGYKVKELFFNNPGVYTPDFAVYFENNQVLYRLLEVYYEKMKKLNFTHHAMTFLTPFHDDFIIQLGYGLRVIDGVRFPKKYIINDSEISIKAAEISDFNNLLPIFKEHNLYMSSSPIFLDAEDPSEELNEVLKDEHKIVFKILYKLEIIGFSIVDKKYAPGGKYFKDSETLGVKGTHIKRKYQNKQIGRRYIELLDNYCVDNGYNRLAVDFESMNLLAVTFWRKHYHLSAKTYVKYLGK